MKNGILVCDWYDPSPKSFTNVIIPRLEYISKKWGAELITVTSLPDAIRNKGWPSNYELNKYGKLIYIEKFCKIYDRLLFLDSDCVVSRNTPNMFELFESGHIYAALDSRDGDEDCFHRNNEMIISQSLLGSIGWTKGYYNSGVILMDNIHKYIFKYNKDVFLTFSDQTWFNYYLRKYGFSHKSLPIPFNSFCMNLEGGTLSPHVANPLFPEIIAKQAYIAHAAGLEQKYKEDYIFKLDTLMP